MCKYETFEEWFITGKHHEHGFETDGVHHYFLDDEDNEIRVAEWSDFKKTSGRFRAIVMFGDGIFIACYFNQIKATYNGTTVIENLNEYEGTYALRINFAIHNVAKRIWELKVN